MAHVEVGFRRPRGLVAQAQFGLGRDRPDVRLSLGRLGALPFEQGVTLEFALDIGFQLQVGELEKLDGLLQLGGDDKALALPDLQPCGERHGRPLGLDPRLGWPSPPIG
jgi:hypothetical protein